MIFSELQEGARFRHHPQAVGISTKILPQPHTIGSDPRYDRCLERGTPREEWVNAVGDDNVREHICPDRIIYPVSESG